MIQHFGLDPLPWKGDVITRISSTMGNSIFVAAYLIMVVPFVLYRLTTGITGYPHARRAQRRARAPWTGPGAALGRCCCWRSRPCCSASSSSWSRCGRVNGDFRYWWVFPLGLVVVAGTFALISRRRPCGPAHA